MSISIMVFPLIPRQGWARSGNATNAILFSIKIYTNKSLVFMNIRTSETKIFGVKIIDIPQVQDDRGFFYEVYRDSIWESTAIPAPLKIKQISQSRSVVGVIRGLHYQTSPPMIKAIRCLQGSARLVAADPRRSSPSFGSVVVIDSVDCPSLFLYCPAGVAVGFAAYTTPTVIEYLCSAEYNPEGQG